VFSGNAEESIGYEPVMFVFQSLSWGIALIMALVITKNNLASKKARLYPNEKQKK
jgi:hypothetical protein